MVDPMLKMIAAYVEHTGKAFPVTLTVGGLLVSGFLCSRSEYTVAIQSYIERNAASVEGDGQGMMSICDAVGDIERDHDIGGEFIHLTSVCLISSQWTAQLSMPWRGLAGSVDGFSVGKIDIATPPERGLNCKGALIDRCLNGCRQFFKARCRSIFSRKK